MYGMFIVLEVTLNSDHSLFAKKVSEMSEGTASKWATKTFQYLQEVSL